MAKKDNEATPNINATANRDIVQRLNFLYQASVYLQSIVPPSEALSGKGKGRETDSNTQHDNTETLNLSRNEAAQKRQKRSKRHKAAKKTTGDLARSYVQCMRAVGQKTTVKMDPSLKRSLCSNCSTILIPGASASVRVKTSSSHGHRMVYTCLHCKATKRIPAPPNPPVSSATVSTMLSSEAPTTEAPDESSSTTPAIETSQKTNSSSRKWERTVHLLPLFARRDAGHVTFRGNEKIALDEDGGLGTAFV